MSAERLWVGNDNIIAVTALTNPVTGLVINSAAISATISDSTGTPVAGVSWPVALDYHAGSSGDYSKVVEGMQLIDGHHYTIVINAAAAGLDAQWRVARRATLRRA